MNAKRLAVVGLGGLIAAGCGVRRIEDDGGIGGQVPAAVRRELDLYCAIPGCHSAGDEPPDLSGEGFLAENGSERPLVVFGDVQGSEIARRILSEDPSYKMPKGFTMPADAQAIVIAWIAGVDFGEGSDGMDPTTGGDGSDTDSGDDSGDDAASTTDAGPGVMFTSFEADVQPIFTERCALPGCHAADTTAPNLTEGAAHSAAVNQPAVMGEGTLVTPGDPESSYLWQKLVGEQGVDYTGLPMPVGLPLTDEQLELIEAWILAGAPD